jgi:dTDP-4-dehydrorhamnose reductase
MKKTVILTGSNGLLGQKIVAKLAGRQAVNLIAVSLGENRFPFPEGYTYESADVSDVQRMGELFEKYKPTEIIHAAAMTNVDACEREPEACRKANVDATGGLVTLCETFHTSMIYISTDFVFKGDKMPCTEKDKPNPISVYGESKMEAEKVVMAMNQPWTVIRTALIYGVMYGSQRSNFVLWARNAMLEGKQVTAVSDEVRSPTLAEDLAEGIVLALMKDKYGIYHISGPEVNSVSFFVHQLAQFWKLNEALITEVTSDSLTRPARRPLKTGFNIIKAQIELGYKPHNFAEGLAIVDAQLKTVF